MRASSIAAVILVYLLMFLCLGTVFADEVWLKNGDHLTGNLVRMENEVLTFETNYAEEVSIKWAEVTNVMTERPIEVVLGDKTRARGPASVAGIRKVRITTEQVEQPFFFDLGKIQIINPRPKGPALKFSGRVNVGANITKGNTNTESVHADAEVVARTEKNRFTMGALYNRAEDDNVKTAGNSTAYMKYDHFLTKKWYLLASASGTKDEFKDLNLKTAVGVGVGYQFLESELTNLSVEAGLSYVNEDFIEAQDDSYAAGRWAVNFDRFLLENHVQFFHVHEGLLGFSSSDDVSIRSQTGFRVPVYNNLNATLQFNYDWDKSPAPGRKKTDKAFIFSLGYNW